MIQSPKHSLKVILLLRSRRKEKRVRAQEERVTSRLHRHSNQAWGLQEALHTHGPVQSSQQLQGVVLRAALWGGEAWGAQRWDPSPVLLLTLLYGLPGSTRWWMAEFSMSPQSTHTLSNSQRSTVSQKALQGDDHFWKGGFISYSKGSSLRHLKFVFPIRNLSSAKRTIYMFFPQNDTAISGRVQISIWVSYQTNHVQMNEQTKLYIGWK